MGERFREIRESHGYSVDDFAKLLKVNRSSIYRYEDNEREIPVGVAMKVCEMYNISLDWLAGTSDIKYRDLSLDKLTAEYKSLTEEAQKEVLNYINYIKSKEK